MHKIKISKKIMVRKLLKRKRRKQVAATNDDSTKERVLKNERVLGPFDFQQLDSIQEDLHRLILARCGSTRLQLIMSDFHLPQLKDETTQNFGVPGMDGGFDIDLRRNDFGEWRLECKSWSRNNDGWRTTQLHEITFKSGIILLEEGLTMCHDEESDQTECCTCSLCNQIAASA